jgi:hypothetical protein
MSSVVVARMSPTEIRRALALDGAGLGTVWGEQKAQQMLAEAGFTSIDVHHLDGDSLNTYYIARKDDSP